jgi:transposase
LLPAMWDWEMMVFLNSFERSEGRWKKLLDEAGFTVVFWAPPGDGQVSFPFSFSSSGGRVVSVRC